jgi:hypothetical protein
MSTVICEYCESEITKYNLIKHKKSESCTKIYKLILKKELLYQNQIKEKEKIINELQEKIDEYIIENTNLKNENKILEKSSEEYRKIVMKVATKTTIKNNYNNYLNYISTEPLKLNDIPKQVKNILNSQTILYDTEDFNDHIVDNILKDNKGKDKLLCTDINRKNFTYKDESSGKLICDPELEKLRDKLKKGADVKSLKKELLDQLIKEFEDNGSLGDDPYMKFCNLIQKLDFGSPFVNHVAKKTYVKTKYNSVNDISESLENDIIESLDNYISDSSDISE